mmetsp:Transcript_9100/g.11841  ORF Transcript_9100/g.11841 Transcript_9100/m.11841 type:complete len:280 (+) Transcript_9100:151-990(+)|eukprot:CAMPEP_0117762422 /NCGR_PEP_ID=MMETSP0947-20121206/17927_1 /TAXON_ID=44440 /ORGANISM="Chattonella subsalsa, Strain CCMP2191" /LENGTH=279 /DNA_ID=CAMNT_0005583723 /DNA_START=118 /DNA_END=957 /DNA_ORIENTATION=+
MVDLVSVLLSRKLQKNSDRLGMKFPEIVTFLKQILLINLFWICFSSCLHTFSIIAVDCITGEIGSAGATCLDENDWPGTGGAILISDIIPGVGVIHTQSYYIPENQANAHEKMAKGQSPQDIIDWLIENDAEGNSTTRQYGIADYNGGSPRFAAFTGENCVDYHGHIVGKNYAVQGNMLGDSHVLDSMSSAFENTEGDLPVKLMAAMQGSNLIGADKRCKVEGTSSLSAFLRVAKPDDHPESLHLDINVPFTDDGVEPIDILQSRYDAWTETKSCFWDL